MNEFAGEVVIEWPAATCRPVVGWDVEITDALTGKQIETCHHMEVHCDARAMVTADLVLFADEDGKPVFDGVPVMKDGEALTGVFSFLVAEMRAGAP